MIPEGWKLVPEFPSIDMIKAGAASIDDNGGNARWADISEAWADMLAAAPTPPAQQDDEALAVLKQAAHALDEAADSIANWASYASDYFREKHDLDGDIKRTRDAAAHFRALLAKRGEK